MDNENFPSFENYLSQNRGVSGNKDKPLKSTLLSEVPKNSTNKRVSVNKQEITSTTDVEYLEETSQD